MLRTFHPVQENRDLNLRDELIIGKGKGQDPLEKLYKKDLVEVLELDDLDESVDIDIMTVNTANQADGCNQTSSARTRVIADYCRDGQSVSLERLLEIHGKGQSQDMKKHRKNQVKYLKSQCSVEEFENQVKYLESRWSVEEFLEMEIEVCKRLYEEQLQRQQVHQFVRTVVDAVVDNEDECSWQLEDSINLDEL